MEAAEDGDFLDRSTDDGWFGRPARDTGLESERSTQPTDAQRLWLLNSSEVRGRIERSRWVRRLVEGPSRDRAAFVPSLYLALLCREPTPEEVAAAEAYLATSGLGLHAGVGDVVWALLSALREQGGQNHVIGRKVTGRLMCGECAVRMRAGLAPAQETLPL